MIDYETIGEGKYKMNREKIMIKANNSRTDSIEDQMISNIG